MALLRRLLAGGLPHRLTGWAFSRWPGLPEADQVWRCPGQCRKYYYTAGCQGRRQRSGVRSRCRASASRPNGTGSLTPRRTHQASGLGCQFALPGLCR